MNPSEQTAELARMLERLPNGRARSLALTKLDEASMWAAYGIAAAEREKTRDAPAPDE